MASLCVMAVDRHEGKTVRYDRRSGLSGTLVGNGIQDDEGLMWFATWNGLNCYDGYDFHRVSIEPGDGSPLGCDRIRDILRAENGNILCRTDDDIYEFDLRTYTFDTIPRGRKDSLRSRLGRRWHGLTDRQGNFWRSDPSGLYKTVSCHHPSTLIQGTGRLHPRSFMTDGNGNLWVGTKTDHRLRVYAPDGSLTRVIEPGTAPYVIFRDSHGQVWTGGKPGMLRKVDGEVVSNDPVYDIAEDRDGHLWIATFGNGVKCIPRPQDDKPWISPSIGGDKVRKLLATPSGNLVAATSDGLMVGTINRTTPAMTRLRPILRDGSSPSSPSSNLVMSLARDSKGNIYICTGSSGIDMISEESLMSDSPEFTHFNVQNSALTSDICTAMALETDTSLMIVAADRVMRLNPEKGTSVSFSRMFWADSCDFSEATPVMLDDGSWLFGAVQGAFRATAHNFYSTDYVPPLVFTTLAIEGGAAEFGLVPRDTVSLGQHERNLSIGFAAIDYIDNTDIQYRTRLDGSTWSAPGTDRSVTLFNLSPGRHELEVQSTDRYGRWTPNARVLVIDVEPQWHETVWARMLFVAIVIAVAAAIVATMLYIRKMNAQRRKLLEKYMAVIRERDIASVTERPIAMPREMPPLTPGQTPEDTAFLDRVRRYIEENIGNSDADVDGMALAAAVSRSTLNRRLKSQLGISAAQLLIEARMRHAALLLAENLDKPLADVAEECGYADVQYFRRVFRQRYGVTPASYRAGDHNPTKSKE